MGQHFWARGYFVSTVGRDETVIREHIRNQELEDEPVDQHQPPAPPGRRRPRPPLARPHDPPRNPP